MLYEKINGGAVMSGQETITYKEPIAEKYLDVYSELCKLPEGTGKSYEELCKVCKGLTDDEVFSALERFMSLGLIIHSDKTDRYYKTPYKNVRIFKS